MQQTLYFDTYSKALWSRPTRSPVLRLAFYRGSTPNIALKFVTDGVVVDAGSNSTVVTLGFKDALTSSTGLIPSVSATKSGSGTTAVYTLAPTFLSTALDTLLGTADSAPAYGEIRVVDGAEIDICEFRCLIYKNVQQGGESVPVAPSGFVTIAASATGNTSVSAAGGSAVVSVTAAAGSGAYTYKVVLITTGVPTGALADVQIELAASANPTVEVRNATTSGTTLHSVAGDSSNITYQRIGFRFNGTAWVKFGPGELA